MRYRNKKTGKEVPEALALEYALDECGIAIVNANMPGFAEFCSVFMDNYYNLEDWDEIEDDDEDEYDEDEVLDLEALRRREYLDVMRERLCV